MKTPALVFAILVLLGGGAAHAHKVVAALYPGNGVVEGEIGFSNGSVAADALVEVFNSAGDKVGETRTDNDGLFRFTPPGKMDLVFRANLGAGHVAEVVLPAADIILGTGDVAKAPADASGGRAEYAPGQPKVLSGPLQRSVVADEVRKAIRPLRKEIAAYREKNDLQSILGGVGYILGIFGIGYYVAAKRRRTARKP